MAQVHELTKAQPRPMDRLKATLNVESVKTQFQNALADNAGPFIASIIDLYGSDNYLQKCEPNAVIMECLKAATLKLPINRQLGFAYVIPYKRNDAYIPQFQLGYKGYIQLAMRTGQYRHLNAGVVYEGVKVNRDLITGEVTFSGEPTSQKPQGYFAYMELLNGFSKTVYMTYAEIVAHAKRYSKSFGNSSSAWSTNFAEMAMKTVVRRLLSHYGILSTDMVAALTSTHEEEDAAMEAEREIAEQANGQVIDVTPSQVEEFPRQAQDAPDKGKEENTQASQPAANGQTQLLMEGPGF